MNKVQLEEARQEIVEVKKDGGITLYPGVEPILLTTTLVMGLEEKEQQKYYKIYGLDNTKQAEVLYHLNKELGVHVLIRSFDGPKSLAEEGSLATRKKLFLPSFYESEDMKRYLADQKIGLFINYVTLHKDYHRDIEVREYQQAADSTSKLVALYSSQLEAEGFTSQGGYSSKNMSNLQLLNLEVLTTENVLCHRQSSYAQANHCFLQQQLATDEKADKAIPKLERLIK